MACSAAAVPRWPNDRLRRVAFPGRSRQGLTGAGDLGGVDPAIVRKGPQQRLVGHQMVEHTGQKARLGRGDSDPLGPDSAQGEEPAEPLGVSGKECKCLNCQGFRSLSGDISRAGHCGAFAFP